MSKFILAAILVAVAVSYSQGTSSSSFSSYPASASSVSIVATGGRVKSSSSSSSSSSGGSKLSSHFKTSGKANTYDCLTECNKPGLKMVGIDTCCPILASVTSQSSTVKGKSISICKCHETVSNGSTRVRGNSKAGKGQRKQYRPKWWRKRNFSS